MITADEQLEKLGWRAYTTFGRRNIKEYCAESNEKIDRRRHVELEVKKGNIGTVKCRYSTSTGSPAPILLDELGAIEMKLIEMGAKM